MKILHSVIHASLLFVAGAAFGADGGSAAVVQAASSIEIPASRGTFDFLRVDAKRHRLLAAHETDGTADYFDLNTNKLITRVRVGGAVDTAMDPDSKYYYVSVQEDKKVAVLDAATLKEVRSIRMEGPTDAIIYEPKNRQIYVTHDDGANLWVIDAASDRVTGSIALPGAPEFMVYDAAADRIYLNIKTADAVVAIDPNTNNVVAQWPTGPATRVHGLALDSASHRIYSAGANGILAALDTTSGRVVSTAKITAGVDQIAFDPKKQLVYCAGPNRMSVVKASADGVRSVGEFATAATARNVAVDPATGAVWTTYTDGTSSFARSWAPD